MTYDKIGHADNNFISRKKILFRKGIALILFAVLIVISIIVVRHYFYILDSYYYSAEFHINFMKNNLGNRNTELLTDYFKSLKTMPKMFTFLLFAYLIKNFWLLFSKPIFVSVITAAAGLYQSVILNYISLLLIGIVSFGIGIFFFGDILLLFFENKSWTNMSPLNKYIAYGIAGTLFSIPIVPVIIPAFLSAIFRIKIRPMIVIMMTGFMFQILLLISLPNLFI